MATYSSNTTIKVNGAIATSQTSGGGATSVNYTAPATGYAIVQAYASGTAATVTVAGIAVGQGTGIYVGPGQQIVASASAGTSSVVSISGVSFVNTP